MDLRLRGKKVVVLGATRGIGRGIAEAFAEEGADVAICARNAAQIDETVSALEAKGVHAAGGALDLTDTAAIRKWIADIAGRMGGIDILVSNASAMVYTNDEADWIANFKLDLLGGGVAALDAARPFLIEGAAAKGDAAFIAISSISASQVYGVESYGAIKAALIHYAKGLSRELAPSHVRVNVVSPGGVYFEGGNWHKIEVESPERFKQIIARNPSGRMASVEDVANAVLFLASPVSGFTTGLNMVVDGGMTVRVSL
ncbi:MAG: SDR family oxidoreductase [Rhizomicrobium sp.]